MRVMGYVTNEMGEIWTREPTWWKLQVLICEPKTFKSYVRRGTHGVGSNKKVKRGNNVIKQKLNDYSALLFYHGTLIGLFIESEMYLFSFSFSTHHYLWFLDSIQIYQNHFLDFVT